ncbi:MAG: glgX 2, partial [Pseudonocardiales bacterium]|nr:glgX 2 [Pseudonocardiales bacterium]
WRGEPSTLGEFAARITGSADLYETSGRRPVASINFVTAHDGFTLLDLVSYNDKHNEANLDGNTDGETHNRSWNCGVEGPTDDPAIVALRAQQRRNFLATLFLSQGVPMLAHGDEIGRTQRGNNNGYCQDNELTWMDWSKVDVDLLAFTRRLSELRREHQIFRRRRFFDGRPVRRRGRDTLPDIQWFTPDGTEMTEEDWESGFGRTIAVYLNGQGIAGRDARGQRVVDDSFLLCFSAHDEAIEFRVPGPEYAEAWEIEIDTLEPGGRDGTLVEADGTVSVGPRALMVLRGVA